MADITIDLLTTQTFYQVPKIFSTRIERKWNEDLKQRVKIKYTSKYVVLSSDAKLAYGALYDRCQASIYSYQNGKRDYVDENGSVFLIYTIQDLMELLDKAKGTVIKIKKELTDMGLLREERLGRNKANRLYLQLVDASCQEMIFYDESDNFIKKLDASGNVLKENKKEAKIVDSSGSSKFGLPKIELPEVQNLDPSNTNISDTNMNISSRKARTDSNTQNKSQKYISPQYYSLLQVIADKYNDRYMYPEGYTLTHHQKMQIGQYLSGGYATSNEVLDMIERIPPACESPLSYLLKMLDNLREERRIEEKMVAHRNAEVFYGNIGGR
ncbi:replication initiator protein A [Streptococcus ovis]|uniref:replication initiator protein A n=1 Tax=Streptococcus ovis TaxID=82806 RepID=UPI00036F7B13|nr:replication initiator protein A [Streptococcus ovis]